MLPNFAFQTISGSIIVDVPELPQLKKAAFMIAAETFLLTLFQFRVLHTPDATEVLSGARGLKNDGPAKN